jgi:hypothetical protein
MLSIGLWRWYINITITILDIIYRAVYRFEYFVILFFIAKNRIQNNCWERWKEKLLTIREFEGFRPLEYDAV